MVMMTDDELTDLRADVVELMPDTCVIKRLTETVDDGFVDTETLAAAGTVICRIDPIELREQTEMIGRQEANITFFKFTVPHDADVRGGDVIELSGDEYQVSQVHDDHSLRAFRRVVTSRVE